ncbi:MAG: PAS domain S-box protein [Leptospiraceae bacterium]|nr:PAS domain S-box protein [Leptospiraceae bacterium]
MQESSGNNDSRNAAPGEGLPEEFSTIITTHFSGGIVITDPDGRVQWANEGFCRLTGFSLKELLGQKPGDLLQGEGTNPETVQRIREQLRRQESLEAEILNYSKEGLPYVLYLKVDPVFRDGELVHFVGFQTDVTARRRQSQLMQSILDSAHHAILSIDISGKIKTFNLGAERFLGYSEQEALQSLDPLDLHSATELQDRANQLSEELGYEVLPGLDLFRIIARESLSDRFKEWTYRRKDGATVYGELALSQMRDSEGRLTGYLGIIKDRTDLHRAEEQLEYSTNQLTKLARQLPGVIYQFELFPDGRSRFPYASEAIRTIYRVSPEEVREDASAVFRTLHPEDLEEVKKAIEKSAESLGPWEQEYRVRFDDGTVRWLYGYANPERLANGNVLWHGFITDITERKKDERRLRESEERLTFALKATEDGVWDWNLKTNEVVWSSRCYEMLGYENAAFAVDFDKWKSLLHPADMDATLHAVQETLDEGGEQMDLTFRLRHREGTYRWITGKGTVTEYDASGAPIRMVGTHLDVTERKLQDEALRNANRRLEDTNRQLELSIWHANELARQAEAANEAKSSFIANMSHEIRTPMTSILGYADLLSEAESSSQQFSEYLGSLKEAGQHLMAIVNDILDMSRIESGRMETEDLAASPVQIMDEVSNMLRERVTRKGLNFRRTVHPDVPEIMVIDPGRLRQILVNLLGNAIKFTESGSLEVEAGTLDEELYLSVKDSGIGISPEGMRNLFQPFMQADTSTTRRFGGSGLGLAISQRLAQMMGGRIEAKSEEGIGSVFTLYLPIRKPSAEDFQSSRERRDPLQSASAGMAQQSAHRQQHEPMGDHGPDEVIKLSGMKVLVVEDDPDIRKIVEIYLRRAGIAPDTLADGKSALKRLMEEQKYDCVLMDIQMPEMDGKTVLANLRNAGYTGTVIAMTAHALSSEVTAILEAGFDEYLPKPINRQSLYECLQRYSSS